MIDRNHPRYLAVYGACIARQTFDMMERGLGAPDDADMSRFVEEAHTVAQRASNRDGDWVHAYLHRKEGDLGNAGYWYARARRPVPAGSLDTEWSAIVEEMLSRP